MECSPIAFFAFNRPYHTMQSLNSLIKNKEAKDTDLYVFIDGHRKFSEVHLVDNVEKVIKSFCGKFNSLTINRSNYNLTGGTNQKRGITEVLSKHETVIVLEDDIYVSENFLAYMNNSLHIYRKENKVFHINGYSYPTKLESEEECFFLRIMLCWGWATWKDRWNKFIEDPLSCDPYYLKNTFTKNMIKDFDLNLKKSLFWAQVLDNANGKLNNTWDIFWYGYIFINKGLCLTPKLSLTRNIGHDGSGIHTYMDEEVLSSKINENPINIFPQFIEEDIYFLNIIRKYLTKKNNLFKRIYRKIMVILFFMLKKIF